MNQGLILSLVLVGIGVGSSFFNLSYAACYDSYTDLCGLLSNNMTQIFTAFRQPLETQVPGFSLVILWGGLMGIIWFKTENIMLMSIVGIVVSATITGLNQIAVGLGMLLVGVSFGILIFQMIRQRVSLFT